VSAPEHRPEKDAEEEPHCADVIGDHQRQSVQPREAGLVHLVDVLEGRAAPGALKDRARSELLQGVGHGDVSVVGKPGGPPGEPPYGTRGRSGAPESSRSDTSAAVISRSAATPSSGAAGGRATNTRRRRA